MKSTRSRRSLHRRLRVLGMLGAGIAAAGLTAALGQWLYAPAVGWTIAALIYNVTVWLSIAPMDHV